MTKLRQIQGALPFFIAVFLNAFVDLGHKIIIQNTVFKLYDGPTQVALTAIVNALILLPFILLLSPAGFLSDRFAKTRVMQMSAWLAVACTICITVFYYLGWFIPAFAMTFLLAAQSAIYSPAKLGYIKELFGKDRLGEANGVVSALAIVAILAGIFAFSILFESLFPAGGAGGESQVLKAIAPVGWLLIATSLIELWMMYQLPNKADANTKASHTSKTFSVKAYLTGGMFKDDIAPLVNSVTIRLSVIGLATFWAVGQVLLATFPAFIKETQGIDDTIIVQGMLACSGIGIAIGSMIAGKVSKHHIETGLLPIGALGIAIGLSILPSLDSLNAFRLCILTIGICGGIFIVPLNALIQFHAKQTELGKTLAANNWVQNVTMLGFLGLTVLFSWFGWQSESLLHIIAVVAAVGCCYTIYKLPQSLTRYVLSFLLSRHYKVIVEGMKNIPPTGGVLMLGNHISWIDWAILQIASPRPVRFVMIRNIYERWYLKWFFDMFGCIPIEQGPRSRKALDTISELLNQGEVVCLFPEGTISRTGHLAEFRKGYERAAENANDDVIILPFYMRGLWGSQFSRSSDHLKAASRTGFKRDIMVAFGEPLPKSTPADILKRRVFDLSVSSWNSYVEELPTVAQAWIKQAKKTGTQLSIADSLGTELSGHKALAGGITLSRRIKHIHEQNVGILLPTSAGGALTNMATLLCGKTIVNLNYTASESALLSALQQAGIKTIVTSERFIKKLERKGIQVENLLKGRHVINLDETSKTISTLEKIATYLTVRLLPSCLLTLFYCRNQDTEKNATILFSSGSEGEPKGVEITHKNVHANVKQIANILNMEADDAVMANLPLFHAFGLTVTQFMPLIEGLPMICHPDPTDVVGSAKAIGKYRATILFGTSTFLRLYARNHKIHPLMLDSLRLVIAGAEKLNDEVRQAFSLKFNVPIFEGYGATETTPVASVNLPDKIDSQTWKVQSGQKKGSVGMPLPGSSCMVVDPDSHEELPTGEAGMILIGGPQVMKGYLNNPEKTNNATTIINGTRWYITGDKGYIDADGFLFIVDRYSRFAKIGGEMVSLGAIESAIQKVIDNPEIEVIITAISDEKKGEKLVALANAEIDSSAIKSALLEAGTNALAIPSQWITLETLPKLGSGKTDFSTAKKIALER